MPESNATLLVIGVGPGIGRAVTALFASKKFQRVALIARGSESLKTEKKALEDAVGQHLKVKTYAVDVANHDALLEALHSVEADLGKPDCVFYNAARVLPSKLLSHDVKEIELDFKINVSALYTVAQQTLPHLIQLAKLGPSTKPALIVTSSLLPHEPVPEWFALSLVKAAQRNLMQSLDLTYGSTGVLLGLINVGGIVSPEEKNLNSSNIADKTWQWYSEDKPGFEVVIRA